MLKAPLHSRFPRPFPITASRSLRISTPPPWPISDKAEKALGKRIRAARAAARQGDIFAKLLQNQIGKMLIVEVDEKTLAVIMGDNPGEFRFTLNGRIQSTNQSPRCRRIFSR
jgi:hypothetical protein